MKINKILIIMSMIFSVQIIGDTVVLKNGKQLENVRTRLSKDSLTVISTDGKVLNFAKAEVKSLRLKSVVMPVKNNVQAKAEAEKEKIRIAETLAETADWEIDPSLRLRVAVVQFKAGTGVTQAEAETVTELVNAAFVKTKLFIIVDRQTMEDASKSLKCAPAECSDQLMKKIRASKAITGVVTKTGSRYYINGTINDPEKDAVDFAESTTAETDAAFPQASELLAKKAAGGIADYADIGIGAKGADSKYEAVIKSMVLPGWGQHSYGTKSGSSWHKWKGIGFGSVFGLTVVNFLYRHQQYTESKKDYKSVHSAFLIMPAVTGAELIYFAKDQQALAEYKGSVQNLNQAMTLIGAVYLLNLADSYFIGKRFLGIGDMEKSTGLNLNASPAFVGSANASLKMEVNYEITYKIIF